MEITVHQVEGRVPVTVLQPHGDLDASNYRDFISKAKEAYDAGARDMVLDLSGIPYMSSSGLVALHTIALMLRGEPPPDEDLGWQALRAIRRDTDGDVHEHCKLCNPQPRVDKVLDMAGFRQFMEVYTDLDAAVASF